MRCHSSAQHRAAHCGTAFFGGDGARVLARGGSTFARCSLPGWGRQGALSTDSGAPACLLHLQNQALWDSTGQWDVDFEAVRRKSPCIVVLFPAASRPGWLPAHSGCARPFWAVLRCVLLCWQPVCTLAETFGDAKQDPEHYALVVDCSLWLGRAQPWRPK